MKKSFDFFLQLFFGIVYFVVGFLLIGVFYDTRMGGILPSIKSKGDINYLQTQLYVKELLRKRLSLDKDGSLDFSKVNFNPTEELKGVVGVNPDCSPGIPANTLDIWLNPKKYPNYKPQFKYSAEYLNEFNRGESFMNFFKKLPCATSSMIYVVSIIPKYNGLWTFFQSVDANLEIKYYTENYVEIKDSVFLFWGLGLVIMFGLFILNWKFFKLRKLWYIEYPNYLFIFGFMLVSINVVQSWPLWKIIA